MFGVLACARQEGAHVPGGGSSGRPVLLPVADGVAVLHDDLVHPGEGMREQHGSLEEAHVASMLGQDEQHVGHLFCRQKADLALTLLAFHTAVSKSGLRARLRTSNTS